MAQKIPAGIRLALLTCLLAVPAFSQQGAPPPDWKEIVPEGFEAFEMKYISQGDFLRLIRTFDLEVTKSEYAGKVLFLQFSDPATRARAIDLYNKMSVPPRQVGLHIQMLLAAEEPLEGYEEVTDPFLLEQLAEELGPRRYQVLDRAYVTVSTDEKGEAYMAGRYKVEIKPRFVEEGFIKFDGLTIRDLDTVIALERRAEAEKTAPRIPPRTPPGVVRRTDTRLIKSKVVVRNGQTIVAGSWAVEDMDASIAVVVTTRLLD